MPPGQGLRARLGRAQLKGAHMNRSTSMLSRLSLIAAIVLLASAADAAAPQAKVTPVMSQALPDFPGKEAVMITVEYPPGAVDPVHRHDAAAFVYVLEGAIVMQVKRSEERRVGKGGEGRV